MVVVGQGYVGLPLAMRAVEMGYDVVGFEVNEARVKRLSGADSYVEDIPSGQLRQGLATGQYLPTADATQLAGFDVALITVPTPLKEARPDLSLIEAAGQHPCDVPESWCAVVLESTTYPGTTEELLAGLLGTIPAWSLGKDFHLGYSPETDRPRQLIILDWWTPRKSCLV